MEIFYYGWIERLTTDQEVAGSIGYHVCLTHRRFSNKKKLPRTDSAILAKYKISLSFQQNSEKTTKALMVLVTRVRFPVNAFASWLSRQRHPPNKAHWSSSMILAWVREYQNLNKRAKQKYFEKNVAVSTLDFESNNSSGDTHHYTTWDGFKLFFDLILSYTLCHRILKYDHLSRLERGANNAKQTECKIARLAQSVERETLNLKVVAGKNKAESVALLAQLVERAAFNRKGRSSYGAIGWWFKPT
ncbi:hypothetical protein H8356DRAFT_1325686 [Neocallimastix lanati (nom. inval.)]|nr:hypothetical protein H8356DRAFT_1325686 [Neocallimastix sp. JGI-2020a]